VLSSLGILEKRAGRNERQQRRRNELRRACAPTGVNKELHVFKPINAGFTVNVKLMWVTQMFWWCRCFNVAKANVKSTFSFCFTLIYVWVLNSHAVILGPSPSSLSQSGPHALNLSTTREFHPWSPPPPPPSWGKSSPLVHFYLSVGVCTFDEAGVLWMQVFCD